MDETTETAARAAETENAPLQQVLQTEPRTHHKGVQILSNGMRVRRKERFREVKQSNKTHIPQLKQPERRQPILLSISFDPFPVSSPLNLHDFGRPAKQGRSLSQLQVHNSSQCRNSTTRRTKVLGHMRSNTSAARNKQSQNWMDKWKRIWYPTTSQH